MSNIIQKLKKSALVGRGGACFPAADKWQMVKNASGELKYVLCNASEGEPGVKKDLFLLKNHFDRVLDGIMIAMKYLEAKKGYIYLNPDYHAALSKKLIANIGNLPIELFKKSHAAGYIGGEETSALNHLEGKRIEPRKKPPFPPVCGLWNAPTLINNVETFYAVSLIDSGRYSNKRFYTIGGDCIYDGVYELDENISIREILKQTDNFPDFDFFVQIGGDASGIVLNQEQLTEKASGSGSITIYSYLKHDPIQLIKNWLDFFYHQTCGQCTPCREGTYRLQEIMNAKDIDWEMIGKIFNSLRESSFCALGCSVPTAVATYVNNVLKEKNKNIHLPQDVIDCICECFTR